MKILHIIPSLDPKGGGPAEGVKQIVLYHKKIGNVLEVVCFDEKEDSFVKEIDFPVHCLGHGLTHYSINFKLISWLKNNISNYDAAVINGIWQFHSSGAWFVLKNSNIPYFVYTHGMLDPWFNKKYPIKFLKKLICWVLVEYRVLRDAKAVLFTCEDEKILARNSFRPFKINEVVVKYGAATPPNRSEVGDKYFFDRFPFLKNKKIILYLGRIHSKKGPDILIKAFKEIASIDNDLYLVMAGPDQAGLAKSLKKLTAKYGIEDRVIWTGMLQGFQKWSAFYSASIFALPSHQENFGIAVAEALACGVPVLISDKVNIWREIKQDGVGFVGGDNVDDTVSSLKKWLCMSDADFNEMKVRSVNAFNERYTIKGMANSLVDTIRAFC